MRTKMEIVREEFGVETVTEAVRMWNWDYDHHPERNFAQTKLQLPYEAPEHPEIPSVEEIERVMKENPINRWKAWICRIGPLLVKKHTAQFLLQEAEDLIYLEKHSQARVPKVYSVFTAIDPEYGPAYYMITEFIEGGPLSPERWNEFSRDTRDKILSRLCEQVRLLRATPAPGYYGRVHRQGFFRRAALLRGRAIKDSGPYDTYEEFLAALYRNNEIGCAAHTDWDIDMNPIAKVVLSRFQSELATCTGRQPVYTHVEPAFHNIIARQYHNEEEDTEDWEVTLIDFQECGWLPAWVQAVAFHDAINLAISYNDTSEEENYIVNRILESFEEDYTPQMKYMRELSRCFNTDVR